VKHPFLRKILAASRLTRHGKLAEATAAIQRALAGTGKAGAHDDAPVTVSATSFAESAQVLDGLVREVSATADAESNATVAQPQSAPADVIDRAPTRPDAGRFVDSSFTGAAGTRAFKMFAPSGFAGEALPLIVMLHGCTQDPDDFAAGTRMNALAQEQGFFVLYPAQALRSNSHKCWNWFSPGDQRRGAGEPALIAGMVRHVLQTHPIDPDRVYVAGLSAGGAMAAILAREYPDLFAAAGVHSGLAPGAASDVASAFSVMKSGPGSRPAPGARSAGRRAGADHGADSGAAAHGSAPVIVIHGSADETVVAANAEAVVEAALAGTTAVAEQVADAEAGGSRRVQRTVWRAADAPPGTPSLAERWLVHGAPHAWSGGAAAGSYTDPKGPDASRAMLRFFRDHPRRAR
jgi:poly(hydroxyalkanoate) depolymerase family esterase